MHICAQRAINLEIKGICDMQTQHHHKEETGQIEAFDTLESMC